MSQNVSFNGSFGSVTGQQRTGNDSKAAVMQECQDMLSHLNQCKNSLQTDANKNLENSTSFTGKARTYQAMADSSDDPALKAKYQKQADEYKQKAEQAQQDYKDLKVMLKEIDDKSGELSNQIRVLQGKEAPEYSINTSPDFKSRDYKENVLGETKHAIPKNGDHWYVDDSKTDKAKMDDFMQGLRDFIGEIHVNASDSWGAWNKTNGYKNR